MGGSLSVLYTLTYPLCTFTHSIQYACYVLLLTQCDIVVLHPKRGTYMTLTTLKKEASYINCVCISKENVFKLWPINPINKFS